uniref:Pre-mRNA 3'-end-processing factor FIP1 n=1 Tax=Zosterops lateralis melanops TaxID=1220523 RepID=A0A8D2PSJ9_ZOSLA
SLLRARTGVQGRGRAQGPPRAGGSQRKGRRLWAERRKHGRDENEAERPEEEKSSAPPPPGSEEEAAENGVVKTKVAEAEDDSDSDSDDDEDDVQVTIGDIKTGAPQFSYGAAPVNLNIKAGGRAYGSSGAKVKGLDLDAPGSINGAPLLEVDLDSFEDKPWRKPGADLSDYFNYGFNEETWKAYC